MSTALGLNDQDFKFGLTKVFFRPGKFAEFDAIMRSDPDHLRQLVNRVQHWLLQSRWKKAQWCALSVIKLKNKILYRASQLIIVQKTVRMYLGKKKKFFSILLVFLVCLIKFLKNIKARKKYLPRIVGIRQIRALQQSVKESEKIIHQLKRDKESSVQQLQQLQSALNNALQTIKTNDRSSERDIKNMVAKLEHQTDELIKVLKGKVEQQKSAEEQERLRKIQEDMARERKRKEVEEQKRLEEDNIRKLRAEMEQKRKV